MTARVVQGFSTNQNTLWREITREQAREIPPIGTLHTKMTREPRLRNKEILPTKMDQSEKHGHEIPPEHPFTNTDQSENDRHEISPTRILHTKTCQ